MPRAALGALAVPPLLVLEQIGLFPGARAVGHARRRAARSAGATSSRLPGNAAEALARRIGRTMPLIYGGGPIGAAAAMRWKAEVNENAKAPAFWQPCTPSCATTRSRAGASTAT